MRKIVLLIILILLVFALEAEVKNPDSPLKGEWNLMPKKLWEVSELDGNPIVFPMITVSENEVLYIFDEKFAVNYSLDKDGKRMASFGKRGQGPGEVAREGLIFALKDWVAIYDFPAKLHFFSRQGNYIDSYSINPGIIPYAFINEYEYISAPPPALEKAQIKYVNLRTGDRRSIKEILYEGRVTRSGMIVALPGFTRMLKLTVDSQNRRIYYGLDDSYHIDIMAFDGTMTGSFSVQCKRPRISDELKRKIITDYFRGSRAEQETESAIKYLGNELTYFEHIQVENGLVFVFRNAIPFQWQSQPIDIFSLDGRYLYRTVFTPGNGLRISSQLSFGDVIYLKKSHLVVCLENSVGDVSIARFKIALPLN